MECFLYTEGRLTTEDLKHAGRRIEFEYLRNSSTNRSADGQAVNINVHSLRWQYDARLASRRSRHAACYTNDAILPTFVGLCQTAMIALTAINFAAWHADRVVAMIGSVTVSDGVPTQVKSAETAIGVFELTTTVDDLDANPVVAESAIIIVGNELETEISV